MRTQIGRCAALLVVLAGGCAWQNDTDEMRASITDAGVSTTSSREAVWLAAPRRGLSAVGKDYLFVGPMTVNREGTRQTYLWFAVGTTIDRHLTGAHKPTLDTVVMLVDGTPMTFDLVAWDDASASSPYRPAIESYASYAARVTGSQVRQLASADTVEAYVTDLNGRSPIYVIVKGDPRAWLHAARYSASMN